MIKYIILFCLLFSCENNSVQKNTNNKEVPQVQQNIYYTVIADQFIQNDYYSNVELKTLLDNKTGNIIYMVISSEGVSITVVQKERNK